MFPFDDVIVDICQIRTNSNIWQILLQNQSINCSVVSYPYRKLWNGNHNNYNHVVDVLWSWQSASGPSTEMVIEICFLSIKSDLWPHPHMDRKETAPLITQTYLPTIVPVLLSFKFFVSRTSPCFDELSKLNPAGHFDYKVSQPHDQVFFCCMRYCLHHEFFIALNMGYPIGLVPECRDTGTSYMILLVTYLKQPPFLFLFGGKHTCRENVRATPLKYNSFDLFLFLLAK